MAASSKRENEVTFYRIYVAENDSEVAYGPQILMDYCDKGERFDWPASVAVTNEGVGKLYDWIGGLSWCPFVAELVKQRIEAIVGDAVQWHGPFAVRGKRYYLLNCVNILDCTLAGSNSNKLFIDASIVGQASLFRAQGFLRRLICSQAFRDDCVSNRDTGIRFGRIKEDGWEELPF